MANVTIKIPNIGDVVAENAATEETLLKILAAMSKSEKTKRDEEKKAVEELKKVTQEEADSKKKNSNATKEQTKETEKNTESSKSTWKSVGNSVMGFGATLAKTAISLTAQFATLYDSMAKDPIGTAQGVVNTGVDLVAKGAKTATTVFEFIPVFGSGIKKAADAAVDLAAQLTKAANDIMAAEFKKTVEALSSYTKAGASFAGGMIEMRTLAHDAGVSITTLKNAAAASTEEFRAMGLSQGDGVRALSKAMSASSTNIGRSGTSLRDEMLALGYSYEEQGAIMAQYMAQQQASGQLEKMTTDEIAKGTKDYAVNLKVISDITGQDAKKLQEKARSESMRGALMNKLDKDQRDNFTKAHSMLAKYGPEVQNALIQQIAGGTITDAKIAANADLVQMIQEIAGNVQQAGGDIVETTGRSMGEARQRLEQSSLAQATDLAGALGSTGLPAAIAGITNNILSSGMTPEMAAKSRQDAIAQSESTDETTTGFKKVTAATNAAAVSMEALASTALPTYAKILGEAMQATANTFVKAIDYINGRINAAPAETVQQKLVNEMAAEGLVDLATTNEQGMAFGGQGNADGGIVSGPKSGFTSTLHGTEAIVPLPDGGSIPVSFGGSGFSELTDLFKQQITKQDEIIRVLSENRDYTERLMHNMS